MLQIVLNTTYGVNRTVVDRSRSSLLAPLTSHAHGTTGARQLVRRERVRAPGAELQASVSYVPDERSMAATTAARAKR